MEKKHSSNIITKNINKKISNKDNTFFIRRRKTFIIEQNSRIYNKEIKKGNSFVYTSLKTLQNQKLKKDIRKKTSIPLSKKDFKEIEEDIKFSILEMRRTCLWELRRQSNDIFNIFENNIKKNKNEDEDEINKIIEKLEDGNNDNQLKKSNTFNNNKSDNKCDDIDNNITDKNNSQKKFKSTKMLLKYNINRKRKSIYGEKFRFYSRGGQIIDSYNENESDEEPETSIYLINPETKFIYIYDTIITLITFYSLIYIPIELAKNFCFCSSNNLLIKIINSFFDILFIIDLIIEFFREFYTKEEEKLIKNNLKIINNYIRGWFFMDLIAALPINILIYYYCKNNPDKICFTYEYNNKLIFFLVLARCLKSFKILKITTRKKNQFVTEITEKCSDNTILGNYMDLFSNIAFIIIGLHILSCIHIFIGRHIYPGWIYINKFENFSTLNLYMISLYYLITTMTTVGYGEIQSDSFIEIIFRIILLAVGIICYSWLISSISNGINKQNYASINYSNECAILESIRRTHRELPYKVYLKIKKHLEYKHFRQKIYDKDLVINALPYSLKNSLIFAMYKPALENFIFFKGISNTNFLVEILSYFTPISGKKNDILIKENEIIEEIYFVREGRLSLEVPINMNNPEESTNKYLSKEFLDYAFELDYEANYSQLKHASNKAISNIMDSENKRTSFYNSFIIKKKESKKHFENNVYLRIHDIHKNDDYGDLYMFFGKRSPFALKGRTKRFKLYSIKKANYANLCEEYSNVFRRIHKKKKHNYKIIKNIFIKTISKFCDAKGIKIKEQFKEKINKAIKEMQKEKIPIEILKNSNKNEINEIDEQINKTIKEFESQIQYISNGIQAKKKKAYENLLKPDSFIDEKNKKNRNKYYLYNAKVKGTAINKKFKNSFLEELNLKDDNNLHYTDSINKNNLLNYKRKKKSILKKNINRKKKEVKTIIKTNIMPNMNLRGIDFDFTESDESVKTVKIYDNNNDKSLESGPNTIKILPQSLINLIKTKINYQQLLNSKNHSTLNAQNYLSLSNKNNNNLKISNNQSKINSNIKSKNMSSNNFTFDKLINEYNKGEKELTNIISNKLDKSRYSKRNFQTKNSFLTNSKISSIKETLSPFRINSPKIKDTNNNNNNIFSHNQFNNYQKCSITNNNILFKLDEKLINSNNVFKEENLSCTSADSFQIKRSYRNINEVTDGDYIKEKKFQIDTIKFVKDYKDNCAKNKKEKKLNSNTSLKEINDKNNISNFLPIQNDIKKVETKVSNYLNSKINLIKKKNSKHKNKDLLSKRSNKKKKKKSGFVNSPIHSRNDNVNNNNPINNKSFNEDSIIRLNSNNNNIKSDET